jgi:hypothetical protein
MTGGWPGRGIYYICYGIYYNPQMRRGRMSGGRVISRRRLSMIQRAKVDSKHNTTTWKEKKKIKVINKEF